MNDAANAAALQEAARAQARGDLAAAVQLYHQLLERAPEFPPALNSLGVIALAQGNTEAAIDFHQRAAAVDSDAPILWVNLAKAQREAGDDAGERTSLDRALAIDGLNFTALVRKAEYCERHGDWVEALRLWQGVLSVAPASPAVEPVLAHARAYVSEQNTRFATSIDDALASARTAAKGSLRRFDAAVGYATGRRQIYRNECAGFHFPFLPADEYFEREHFPWLPEIEAATDDIRGELTQLLESGAPGFAPYVQMAPGTPENKWTPLDGQMAWGAYYLWQYGKPVSDAAQRCPLTMAALSRVPQLHLKGRCPSAFFSLLQPGAHIPPHTGVTNLRAIIHVPLIVPGDCGFRVGGETREWQVGTAFAFDDTIEHEAWNRSDTLRAILILDVWNPHISEEERGLVAEFFEVADSSGIGGGDAESF